MNVRLRPVPRPARLLAVALAILAAAGCNNVFVPKHRVLVDAIAAPGLVAKPSGTSYRLVAKRSTVSNTQVQIEVIKACVDAAFGTKGMFEAPENVAPDVFIEVGFGVVATPRADAASRETFLQLSARDNPARAIDRGTGPELWDVKVSVMGVAGRMETAMPLLSAVAVDYIGTDTKLETRIEIPQNSTAVAGVREGAIKTLEGKGGGRPAAAGAAVNPVRTK